MAKGSGTTKSSSSSSPKGLKKTEKIPPYERYEVKNALSYIHGGLSSAEMTTKAFENDTTVLVKMYNQYEKTIKGIPKNLNIAEKSAMRNEARKKLMDNIEKYADKRRKEELDKIDELIAKRKKLNS